jgi:hypothetical protein
MAGSEACYNCQKAKIPNSVFIQQDNQVVINKEAPNENDKNKADEWLFKRIMESRIRMSMGFPF